MNTLFIRNGNVVLPDTILERASLLIKGARIAAVDVKGRPPRGATVIDADGAFVSPGFIDTHIHGTPGDIFRNEIRGGTTSIVVALSCDSLPRMYKRIDEIAAFTDTDIFGPNVIGVRLEGPFINPARKGAQDAAHIRPPKKRDAEKIIARCGPLLKMMTVAPELAGSTGVIMALWRRGVIASLGHSDATGDEARRGIDTGISHATHLFNAMGEKSTDLRGAVGALLLDRRVTVELIADLAHVPAELLCHALRANGLERTVVVTDSLTAEPPAGAAKRGGVYLMPDGRKAGSAVTMAEAVRNVVRACNLSIPEAVRLATENPARLFGCAARKGSIAVGKDADIAIFDKDFQVQTTVVRGKITFQKKGARVQGPGVR